MRMRMRTRAAAASVVLALAGAAAAGALDFGANLNSRSDFSADETLLGTVGSVWVRSTPVIAAEPAVRYVIEANVTNRLRFAAGEEAESEFFADVELASARVILPGVPAGAVSEVSAGRLALSEPTALVLADRVDGLAYRVDFAGVGVTAGAGYSGLIDGRNTGIIMSEADERAVADEEVRAGSQRLVTVLTAEMPQLIGRHDLALGAVAQWDLREAGENGEGLDGGTGADGGEGLDSQYAVGSLDGAIADGLYYTAGAAGAYMQEGDAEGFGIGARGDIELFLGAADAHVITVASRYASGPGEALSAFEPISAAGLDTLEPLPDSDLLAGSLEYAVRPFAGRAGAAGDWLGISAYGTAGFRSDPGAGGAYRGVEAGLRAAARPFSDIGAQARVAGHAPGDDPAAIDVLARVELSARF